MRNLVEYLLTTVIALTLAYLVITPIVERTTKMMNDSANLIAASR